MKVARLLVVIALLAQGCGDDRARGITDAGPVRDGAGSDARPGGDAGGDGGSGEIPTVTLTECFDAVGAGGDGRANDLALAGGVVYAIGYFAESLTLGASSVPTTRERAAFVLALDASSGDGAWIDAFESSGRAEGATIDVLPGGDLAVTMVADADLVIGTETLAAGMTVARLDPDTREPVWARTLTATESVFATHGKLSPEGLLVVSGRFNGQLPVDASTTLDAGSGTAGPDGYAIAFDPATGDVRWAVSFGSGGGFDDVEGMIFADGDVFLTGPTRSDGSIDARLYVERIDGTTGAVEWRQRFDPTEGTGRRQAFGSALVWTADGLLVSGSAEDGSDVGTGALVVADDPSSFAALYDPSDGTGVSAEVFPSRLRGVVPIALAPRDGIVPLFDGQAFVALSLETLAPTARWSIDRSPSLYPHHAVESEGRVYLAVTSGNVLGSLDPAVVCVELP